MRFDHRVAEPLPVGESRGLLDRVERQAHLVEGVVGAGPAHQRVARAAGHRLEFEHPFAGPSAPRLHRRFGRPVNPRLRHRYPQLQARSR